VGELEVVANLKLSPVSIEWVLLDIWNYRKYQLFSLRKIENFVNKYISNIYFYTIIQNFQYILTKLIRLFTDIDGCFEIF
jgi:hypothetical protein